MKYRIKHIVDAFQLTEAVILHSLISREPVIWDITASGSYHPEKRILWNGYCSVPTKQGPLRADATDWILRAQDGSYNVLSNESFQRAYEPA